jgi:DNA-binding NarL/FixJ family response regulator
MQDKHTVDIFAAITLRRAQVLRGLADGMTEREIAKELTLAHSSVRSHVEALKNLTGQKSTRELGRWWRTNREAWLRYWAEESGTQCAAG